MAKEVKDMTAEELREALLKEQADKAKVQEESAKVVKDLKSKLSDAKASQKGEVLVTVGEDTYEFTANKFTIPSPEFGGEGTTMIAEEAKKDAEFCKNLVETKSGLLKKIVKK
jgi:hypothetical protein